MRYSLRNQKKIAAVHGQAKLEMLLTSLTVYFAQYREPFLEDSDRKFKKIVIPNKTGGNVMEFYVLKITYDVYNLALKSC